jgi:peptide-N-glycosidase F-like protein
VPCNTNQKMKRIMKRILLLVLSIYIFGCGFSQDLIEENKIYKVYYHTYYNGKSTEESEQILEYNNDIVYLSKPDSKIRYFMDFSTNCNVSIIKTDQGLFSTIIPFDSLQQPTFSEESEFILGYKCKTATYKAFSNTIDVWYTDDVGIAGALYRNYLPDPNALVLKIVINGNRTIMADSIVSYDNEFIQNYPIEKAMEISLPEFEELKILSRYTTVSIFKNETINFNPEYWINNIYDSITDVYHYSKGSVILKKLIVPEIVKNGTYVFANLTCRSEGDAYDRTGSVFVISEKDELISMLDAMKDSLEVLPVYHDNNGKKYQGINKGSYYEPPVEVMRFFTSFGAGHFNDLRVINNYQWEAEAIYKQEISDVFPVDKEHVWVGVFIGNYDRGGHKINLDFDFYPSFDDGVEPDQWIQPVVYTVNILEMLNQEYGRLFSNDTLVTYFNVPDSIDNLKLFYTSTGHGGWGGGDEFNPKLNEIFIDGEKVFSFIPWRSDCATYRLYNPSSGNFGNGLSSSDLSRSNWCPGTLTPPSIINLDSLKAGNHIIEIVIDQGEDEGSSFSHWGVSATLIGDVKQKD